MKLNLARVFDELEADDPYEDPDEELAFDAEEPWGQGMSPEFRARLLSDPVRPIYNAQCLNGGHVFVAPEGSELEKRCIARAANGYLDALIVLSDECPECIKEYNQMAWFYEPCPDPGIDDDDPGDAEQYEDPYDPMNFDFDDDDRTASEWDQMARRLQAELAPYFS